MASVHCPHCGAPLPGTRTWSQAVISTLVPAPAVPDMATQVRCDACGRVSAAGDLRHTVADRFHVRWVAVGIAAAALLAWLLA